MVLPYSPLILNREKQFTLQINAVCKKILMLLMNFLEDDAHPSHPASSWDGRVANLTKALGVHVWRWVWAEIKCMNLGYLGRSGLKLPLMIRRDFTDPRNDGWICSFFGNGNKNRAVWTDVGRRWPDLSHHYSSNCPGPYGFFRVKTYLISWGYNTHPQKLTSIPKMAIFETFYKP